MIKKIIKSLIPKFVLKNKKKKKKQKMRDNFSKMNQYEIFKEIYLSKLWSPNPTKEDYKFFSGLGSYLPEFVNDYIEMVSSHVADTSLLIANAIKNNKTILFEGAQGTLLDIDHGTYPFVTSSNTSSGNAATGSGVGPKNLDKIVGVTKAYISRVGSGPFLTEQENEIGDYLIEKGAEFGVVTGRRRRCGWLDLISLKYSVRINSLTELFITKLDP